MWRLLRKVLRTMSYGRKGFQNGAVQLRIDPDEMRRQEKEKRSGQKHLFRVTRSCHAMPCAYPPGIRRYKFCLTAVWHHAIVHAMQAGGLLATSQRGRRAETQTGRARRIRTFTEGERHAESGLGAVDWTFGHVRGRASSSESTGLAWRPWEMGDRHVAEREVGRPREVGH